MTQYSQKVVLITGSAKRIGAETIKKFHAANYNCIIHCRHSQQAAEQLATELNMQRENSAQVMLADLAKEQDIIQLSKSAVACWGRLDVLINNASSFYPTKIDTSQNAAFITTQVWDDLFSSNAKAPLLLSHHLANALANTKGCILNLTDIHAEKPLNDHTVYCMAKAALVMMTKSLAKELAPRVRVNAVSPGAILWPEQALNETEKERVLSEIALARMGVPTDIADTLLFLAQSNYITGQIIAVDGGRSLGGQAKA